MDAMMNNENKEILEQLNIDVFDSVMACGFVVTTTYPEYKLIYANDIFVKMLGFSDYSEMYDALNGSAAGYVAEEDVGRVTALGKSRTGEGAYEITYRVQGKDGTKHYVNQLSRHKTLKDGREIILATYFDVDEYSDSAKRREKYSQLEIENERMNIAVKNSNMIIWDFIFAERKNIYSRETSVKYNIPQVMENVPESIIDLGLVHPDSVERLKNMYKAVIQGAPSAEGEIECVKNGKIFWSRLRMVTVYAAGEPVSAVCVSNDITREKSLIVKMEGEIMRRTCYESTMRGKGYYDLTDNSIIDYDLIRLVPEELRNLRFYSDAVECVAEQIPDMTESGEFRRLFAPQHLINLFNNGITETNYEYRRIVPDGGVSWVNTRVHLACQPSSGHIVAFMYTDDVNDKRQTQEVLNAIVTEGYDYILIVNADSGKYKMFAHSPNCGAIMPNFGDDYWGDLKTYLKPLLSTEDFKGAMISRKWAPIKEKIDSAGVCEFISDIMLPDGAKRTRKVQYSYLDKANGVILVTGIDITTALEENKKQKQILENALLAAKQASSAKSDFLSRMSHEIRTPMNAILGMVALAMQEMDNKEEVMDCISKIGISGHYLLSLINDILDMSRIESGKILLHNDRFNFAEFIGGINTVIYGQTESKQINYEVVVAHGIDDGYIGDAMKLQQVLINILGNAIKFTPTGGKITFSIGLVSRTEKHAKIRFAINDTGCGIKEEAMKRIFEPFEQQDNSITSMYGGSGLGLAIAKNLVELMGGTIRVRSIVDVGSEFTVEIPLEIDQSITMKNPIKYSFADLHTLIVDDDIMVCEQTARTLRDIGMIPEWVTGGKEAVFKVEEMWNLNQSFDFILVDWKMPEMDGIETIRQIRGIVGPDVTIIIITAYDWVAIEAEAKAAGANMCISKPMFKSTLVSAFTKATGEAERERAISAQPEFDFAGRRILIAEDHPLNAEIATKLLEKKHCTIEVAENGLKALEKFTSTPVGYYDAILMDVRMPIMDGLQATNNIRHWSKADAKTIPIIAMTANAFDEDIEKSKLAGMDAHLAKPVDPQLLYRSLYRLMK